MNVNNHAEDKVLRDFFADAAAAFPPPDGLKERIRSQMTVAASDCFVTTPAADGAMPLRTGIGRRRRWVRRLVPITAAAAVMVAAGLCWHFLLGGGTPLTLAQVIAAAEAKTWGHLKYSNGYEWWYCLQDGRSATKEPTGHLWYSSPREGVLRHYYPPTHQPPAPGEDAAGVIADYRDLTASPPPPVPPTAWDIFVAGAEGSAKEPPDHPWQTEVQKDQVEGRELIRFDRYHTDLLGNRKLQWQLWADPSSRLPVRSRMRSQTHWPSPQPEFVIGHYDFPADGPADLYALGAPRQAQVIVYSAALRPHLQALKQTLQEANGRFPSRYRYVTWDRGHVTVVYRNGWQSRLEYYTYWNPADKDRNACPATVDDALAWSRSLIQFQLLVDEGERMYNLFRPVKHSVMQKPSLNVSAYPRQAGPVTVSKLSGRLRPQPEWPTAELLPVNEDTPPGCIGVRSRNDPRVSATTREDLYYDPTHDHLCVKRVIWKKNGDQWQRQLVVGATGFYQLPEGQWCFRSLDVLWRNGQVNPPGTPDYWDLKLLEQNEFPTDTFDGRKVLEQARAEGIEITSP